MFCGFLTLHSAIACCSVLHYITGVAQHQRNTGKGDQMIKIVHMKILGGWFVVRGAHWAPLAGPFATRAEAKTWLDRKK
jgi:hypothetical protein